MKRLTLPCLAVLAIGFNASAQLPTTKMNTSVLADRLANAKTESERLLACIEAIDKKLICKGCDLETVNKLFGSHFSTNDLSVQGDDNLFNAVVPLRTSTTVLWDRPSTTPEGSAAEKRPPSATAITGWRLEFKYDSYGKIRSYYLSNATQAPMGF